MAAWDTQRMHNIRYKDTGKRLLVSTSFTARLLAPYSHYKRVQIKGAYIHIQSYNLHLSMTILSELNIDGQRSSRQRS